MVAVRRTLLTALAVALLTPAARAAGQPVLPEYRPLNPLLSTRSTLAAEPYRDGGRCWQFGATGAYGSAAEYYSGAEGVVILDAELHRVTLLARCGLGRTVFIEAAVTGTGAHDGFADAFFDAFHGLISYRQAGREARPRNRFAFHVALRDGPVLELDAARLRSSDVAITAGVTITPGMQSMLHVGLPVHGPHGLSSTSVGASQTVRVRPRAVIAAEASAAVAVAPRRGALRAVQRSVLLAAASGIDVHVAGAWGIYVSAFYHSPAYHHSGVPLLDRGELSTDFGLRLRTAGNRVLRLGLVEDLRRDAGIDLVLRLELVN